MQQSYNIKTTLKNLLNKQNFPVPERFLNIDTLDDRYRFAHLTFGAGINSCAGRQYAILQCTIILAMAMRKFRIDLAPFQRVSPDFPDRITMTLSKI